MSERSYALSSSRENEWELEHAWFSVRSVEFDSAEGSQDVLNLRARRQWKLSSSRPTRAVSEHASNQNTITTTGTFAFSFFLTNIRGSMFSFIKYYTMSVWRSTCLAKVSESYCQKLMTPACMEVESPRMWNHQRKRDFSQSQFVCLWFLSIEFKKQTLPLLDFFSNWPVYLANFQDFYFPSAS